MGVTLREQALLLITSFSRVVTNILSQPVSRESGPKPEVSSIMMPSLSSYGLTKRINSESSPCKRDPTSWRFSRELLMLPTRLRPWQNSPTMSISVTFQLAQPTWEQVLELQFILTSQNSWPRRTSWTPSLISTTFKSEVFTESTLKLMTVFFDISNLRRLGRNEVELVQDMY